MWGSLCLYARQYEIFEAAITMIRRSYLTLHYWGGQGDLVNGLIKEINGFTIWAECP